MTRYSFILNLNLCFCFVFLFVLHFLSSGFADDDLTKAGFDFNLCSAAAAFTFIRPFTIWPVLVGLVSTLNIGIASVLQTAEAGTY